MQIAVIGGGFCSPEDCQKARLIGRTLAQRGHVILCGGRGGVMEEACRGAMEVGGLTVGILPKGKEEANPYLSVIIETGMDYARNAIIVKSAQAVIALPGEYGTLSEMALALKMGKKVISLGSWDVPGALKANTPEEAVSLAEDVR